MVCGLLPPVATIESVWVSLKSRGTALPVRSIAHVAERPCNEAKACLHWLVRKKLARIELDPVDRRRKLYQAIGDFQDSCWNDFHADHAEAVAALNELREVWRVQG